MQLLLTRLNVLVIHGWWSRRRLILVILVLPCYSALSEAILMRWLVIRLSNVWRLWAVVSCETLLMLVHRRPVIVLCVASTSHEHRWTETKSSASGKRGPSRGMVLHHATLATFGEDKEENEDKEKNASNNRPDNSSRS